MLTDPYHQQTVLHALGLRGHDGMSYRNHYWAPTDRSCPAAQRCWTMVARYQMHRVKRDPNGGLDLFVVTVAGARAAGVLHRVRDEDRFVPPVPVFDEEDDE